MIASFIDLCLRGDFHCIATATILIAAFVCAQISMTTALYPSDHGQLEVIMHYSPMGYLRAMWPRLLLAFPSSLLYLVMMLVRSGLLSALLPLRNHTVPILAKYSDREYAKIRILYETDVKKEQEDQQAELKERMAQAASAMGLTTERPEGYDSEGFND